MDDGEGEDVGRSKAALVSEKLEEREGDAWDVEFPGEVEERNDGIEEGGVFGFWRRMQGVEEVRVGFAMDPSKEEFEVVSLLNHLDER